jgi:hypothetical protein
LEPSDWKGMDMQRAQDVMHVMSCSEVIAQEKGKMRAKTRRRVNWACT